MTRTKPAISALLEAVERVRALERRMRSEEMSTDEYHRVADELTDRSRDVFRLVWEEEEATGGDMDERAGWTIEGSAPQGTGTRARFY